MKLLLVEDEKRMAEALMEILRLENYEADLCTDGVTGLQAVENGGPYDVIILDVMLPGLSGFEIVKQARQKGIRTPVLMLTAKSELDDKVTGLDSGADDYLTKPFMTRELLARLRALTRRTINRTDGTLSFGDLSLSRESYTLRCTANGQSVRLREKEYRIMEYMMVNQDRVLTREQLALKLWGYENETECYYSRLICPCPSIVLNFSNSITRLSEQSNR